MGKCASIELTGNLLSNALVYFLESASNPGIDQTLDCLSAAMARWLAAILLTHMGVLLLCTCSKSETASKAPLAQHQHLLITGVGAASSMGHLMAESDYSPTVFAGSNLHCPIYSCKYGEIAKDRVFASLVKLSSSMEPLANDSSLIIPGDTQVKDARKVCMPWESSRNATLLHITGSVDT